MRLIESSDVRTQPLKMWGESLNFLTTVGLLERWTDNQTHPVFLKADNMEEMSGLRNRVAVGVGHNEISWPAGRL